MSDGGFGWSGDSGDSISHHMIYTFNNDDEFVVRMQAELGTTIARLALFIIHDLTGESLTSENVAERLLEKYNNASLFSQFLDGLNKLSERERAGINKQKLKALYSGAQSLRAGSKVKKEMIFLQGYQTITTILLAYICDDNNFIEEVNSRFQFKVEALKGQELANTGGRFPLLNLLSWKS